MRAPRKGRPPSLGGTDENSTRDHGGARRWMPMRVFLIAATQLVNPADINGGMRQAGYVEHQNWQVGGEKVSDADELAEFAGRLCYLSWGRPNPATATNQGYLANILDHQHFSVLEHSTVTLLAVKVSRSFTHELIRHRIMSFSEVSQRYVDVGNSSIVVPPAAKELGLQVDIISSAQRAQDVYRELVDEMADGGLLRKQAREAARSVLPSAIETKIVVSGNLRAWRELISKRIAVDENGTPFADAEMYEFACKALAIMKGYAPNTFQDM